MRAKAESCSHLAIPFISYTQSGFVLAKEAQDFLESLPDGLKVSVISIVGKYRTGKSFFVNRVLLGRRKAGFQVGSTINPCTKGLWLWRENLTPDAGRVTLLVDTEGFGGMDEDLNHDSQIFLFSLLVASFFVYNSVGSIDENSLNTLSLITNLANTLAQSGSPFQFPALLWVIRDFTLQMVDKEGRKLTEQEYIERALEDLKGSTDSVQQKNKVRRLIRKHFTQRECRTMVRPVQFEKDLQRLDQLQNDSLRPEFMRQVEAIRARVFERALPKKCNGVELDGKMLAYLVRSMVDTVNSGAIPSIENSWHYVRKSIGQKALLDALELANRLLDQMPLQDYKSQIQAVRAKAVLLFEQKCCGQSDPDLKKALQERLGERLSRKQKDLEGKLQQLYEQTISEHLSPISHLNYDSVQLMQKFRELEHNYRKLPESELKWAKFQALTSEVLANVLEKVEHQQRLRAKVCQAQLTEEIDAMQQKLAEQATTIAVLGQRAQEQAVQGEAAKQLRLKQLQLQSLRQDLTRQKERCKSYEATMVSLKAELLSVSDRRNGAADQLKKAREKGQALKQELERCKAELSQLSLRLEGSEKKVASLSLEKGYLQGQVTFLKNTLQQNGKMQEALITALGSNKRPDADLSEQQRAMLSSIQKLEVRNRLLEEKCQRLKQFKKVVKGVSYLVCASCGRKVTAQESAAHFSQCAMGDKENRTGFQRPALEGLNLTIVQTLLKDTDGKPFTQYVVQASSRNKKWTFTRKYRAFCELHRQLGMVKGAVLPQPGSIVTELTDLPALYAMRKGSLIEDRRRNLQDYLRDVLKQPLLRESQALRQFICEPID